MTDNQRAELAAFLEAHRARLTPKDVGLFEDLEPGRRRTPGLRREEVAELAGVSLTWYTWLEQARKIAASPQVVDALMPDLAVVHDGHLDFVVWNAAFARIRVDPAELPADRRNLLWWMFTDERTRAMMPRWEPAARAILGQFRALVGRTPDDPHLNSIVAGLTEASPQFRIWWQAYPVQDFHASSITLDHPAAGPLSLDVYQLRLVENPDLLMVVHLPSTAEDRDRIRTLLDNDPAN